MISLTADNKIEQAYSQRVADFVQAMSKMGILNMTTWSQIEMASSVVGMKVDEEIFLFLLKASAVFKNIRKIMLNGITHSRFLASYASADKTADVLYEISSIQGMYSSALSAVVKLFDQSMFDSSIMLTYKPKIREKLGYELMTEFDKKFPLMFIRFFGRNSKKLCASDMTFVNWLTSRTKMKSKTNPQFESILALIEKEKALSMKTNAFMK